MEFHPYAESFPLLDGKKYERFRADIASTGGPRQPIKYRLVNGGTKQGLDGRNRIRACDDLELPCPEEKVTVPDDEVEAYIDSLNLHRRHLTQEEQMEERAARVKRVAELRAKGQSYRQIAEQEGISQTQAKRDAESSETENEENINVSTVTPVTVENNETASNPEVVTGKDNKTRKAKTRKLCEACESRENRGKPVIKDCPDCKELNKKPKKAKTPKSLREEVDEAQQPGPVADKTIEEIMKEKNSALESFCRKIMKIVDDEMPDDEWLDYMNRKAGAIQKFKDACSAVRSAKCSHVCPMCKGEGCSKCQKTGRVPHYQYQQLV